MLFPFLKDNLLNFYKHRIYIASAFAVLFGVVLFARLFYLQVIKYEDFVRLSDSNRMRITKIPAERGFIFDRKGNILVKNAPAYELKIVKEDAENLDALLKRINAVSRFDIAKAKRNIRRSYFYQPTVILRGIDFSQVAYFLEHSSDFAGLEIDLQSVRSYPDGKSISHLMGYMGEVTDDDLTVGSSYQPGDFMGKSGVEKIYENYLRGQDGARQVEVDSFGRVYEILNEREAVPGNNVILTVDYDLQKHIADKYGDRRIAVTVLDIKDNSILAMYSAPSYDLNMFTPFVTEDDWAALVRNPVKPLLNRNIEGMYPPGSVYKVLMALAGLKEGVVTPNTVFRCTGSYRLNSNFSYNCWKKGGHGDVNLRKALSASCDVYFYNLGRLLEIDKIHEYSDFFSLGRQTGIDLSNEKAGFFPSREWKLKSRGEAWFPGETIITSIGQGFMTATPLQVGVMMSGIFNGGKVYKPRIADRIEDNEGKKIANIDPVLLRSMDIPEEIRRYIMGGLVDSVYERGGTSSRARVSKVTIGGKTGTAQVVSLKKTEDMKEEEIPENWRDHSWFTGVFPAENPEYVVVVMVEHGGSGGKSAAPVGGDIIKKMLELGYVSKN